jgi:hypothetical protein
MRRLGLLAVVLCLGCASRAATPATQPAAAAPPVEADEYTRYELLAPETAQFHILYEVTAIAPGATIFFNPIRRGSVATDERVIDRMTGEDLRFEVVSAEEASRTGLADAEKGMEYIRIHLARPVPPDGGQARLLIEKTYKDPKSYFAEGDVIVFTRTLSIRRNGILLPAGFELISCSVPSQVFSERGRTLVSFMNAGPDEASLTIRARRLPS